MTHAEHRTGRRAAALLPLLLIMSGAACDGLFDSGEDYAENARIIVTGTSSQPLLLILSNRFTSTITEMGEVVVTIELADTISLSLPIDRTYPLGSQYRILARVQNSDTSTTASINMRVLLDNDEVYNENGTIKESYLEFRFNYF